MSGIAHLVNTSGPEARTLRDAGRWLIDHRREMEQGESGWLDGLARFDDETGWAADGQLSCVDWLRWKTKMSRSSCYEKVHLAHALQEHEAVGEAFRAGRISYSAARLITRLESLAPETETALVLLAERGTVRELEHACEAYRLRADQERPPPDPHLHRGVRVRPDLEGWARVEITMPMVEAKELEAVLDAFMAVDRRDRPQTATSGEAPAARADDERAGAPAGPAPRTEAGGAASARVDDQDAQETAADTAALDDEHGVTAGPAGLDRDAQQWRATRAIAFIEMIRCALAHVDDGRAAGDDRYLVHVVARDGEVTLIDGTPIDPATAAEICCDTSLVAHTVDEHGEPLHQGRKTREWSIAQRRAVLARDGGCCRWPGCERRVRDLHHRHPWEHGGPTDVDNAMATCRAHHSLLHHGFTVTAQADGGLSFTAPDGAHLGSTYPVQGRLAVAA